MQKITVTPGALALAERVLAGNFEPRGEFDGRRDHKQTGALAEILTIHHLLPYLTGKQLTIEEVADRLADKIGTFDGGLDFRIHGLNVDIKSKRTGRPEMATDIHHVYDYQLTDKYKADVYLFTAYDYRGKVLTICGWQSKEEVLKWKQVKQGELLPNDSDKAFPRMARTASHYCENAGLVDFYNRASFAQQMRELSEKRIFDANV